MWRKILSFFSYPENAFILLGIIYGFLFLVMIPPFGVEDECNHFYRAFHVSEGNIIAKKYENRTGDFLPKSLGITTVSLSRIFPDPGSENKVKDLIPLLKLPLNPKDRDFIDFPNTAQYSPIPYMPQAIGIFIGRMFHLSPLMLMYLSRMFNLSLWLFLIYLAIRITPISKWLLFLLVLTPKSLYQAASVSSDCFTNGISVLSIAIFLLYAFKAGKILKKVDLFILFSLSLLLSFSKQIYFTILFMFLLIPIERIGTRREYFT